MEGGQDRAGHHIGVEFLLRHKQLLEPLRIGNLIVVDECEEGTRGSRLHGSVAGLRDPPLRLDDISNFPRTCRNLRCYDGAR